MKLKQLFEAQDDIASDILKAIAKVKKEKNITAFVSSPAGGFVADVLSDMGHEEKVAKQYKNWYIDNANRGFENPKCPWGQAVCDASIDLYQYEENETKDVKMDQGDLGS